MLNGKAIIIVLIGGLIKKTEYKWVNIFQKQNSYKEERKLN